MSDGCTEMLREEMLEEGWHEYSDKYDQPPPMPNFSPAIWDLVVGDMKDRDIIGRMRYGTPLQPHNGRDALADAYQEALDLCAYLRQAIFERDGK